MPPLRTVVVLSILTVLSLLCAGIVLLSPPPAKPVTFEGALMDTVYPYTLFLDEEGVKEGYFPVGMRPGMPGLMVNCGFNLVQDASFFKGYGQGTPFPLDIHLDESGTRLFCMAPGATMLSWRGFPYKSKEYGPIPTAVDTKGNPHSGRNKVNLFSRSARDWLFGYAHDHVKSYVSSAKHNKRILFWGLDNEYEKLADRSPATHEAFALWLENAYRQDGVQGLNAAWGSAFATIQGAARAPYIEYEDYAKAPGRFLDWINCNTEYFAKFEAERAKIMYETDPMHRGVLDKTTQQTINMPKANRERNVDHDLLAQLLRPYSGGYYACNIYGNGDRQAFEVNYIYNCILPLDRKRGYGAMLTENNNHGRPGHQWASTNWRILANGYKGGNMFCTGWANAKNDYDIFGSIDSKTGKPKAKLFYAARWVQAIHRHEKFWTEAMPVVGDKKIALLMPRRDVLLSDVSPRHPSKWGYTRDHHWMVYRWLREQGYWVDVIPYSKLDSEFLKPYQCLTLINANHLRKSEAQAIRNYVGNGGKLIADSRCGMYDEHHRERNYLRDVVGGTYASYKESDRPVVRYNDHQLRGITSVDFTPLTARRSTPEQKGHVQCFVNTFGKGAVLYIATELGALQYNTTAKALASTEGVVGPTADSEDYSAENKEEIVGNWLGTLLSRLGMTRSCMPVEENKLLSAKLRIEMPYKDEQGNLAVVVCNRGLIDQEVIPSAKVCLDLPAGDWKQAHWEPAEGYNSTKLAVEEERKGRYLLTLPEIKTAGVLWFYKDSAPQISVSNPGSIEKSLDGFGAKIPAGKPFEINGNVTNHARGKLESGKLRLLVPAGWCADKKEIATPALNPGEVFSFAYTVTAPAKSKLIKPDWLSPIVLRWNDGKEDKAVSSINVEITMPEEKILRLLTENKTYPATYPYRIKTGATYSYPGTPAKEIHDPASKKKEVSDTALQNGYGNRHGMRYSDIPNRFAYATYTAKTITVLYDLKKSYNVNKIVIGSAPGSDLPTVKSVMLGKDVDTLQEIQVAWQYADTTTTAPESISEWFEGRGRYVKICLEFSSETPALDEIEVWGTEQK